MPRGSQETRPRNLSYRYDLTPTPPITVALYFLFVCSFFSFFFLSENTFANLRFTLESGIDTHKVIEIVSRRVIIAPMRHDHRYLVVLEVSKPFPLLRHDSRFTCCVFTSRLVHASVHLSVLSFRRSRVAGFIRSFVRLFIYLFVCFFWKTGKMREKRVRVVKFGGRKKS